MTNCAKKYNKLRSLQSQVDKLTEEISEELARKIGEDYFIHYDRGDGWLIVSCDTSYQSKIGFMDISFDELMNLDGEKLKEAIDSQRFN